MTARTPTPGWIRLPPHPGFALVDRDGSCRAYFNCRPDDAIIGQWKRRYPDHAADIDQALDACFPLED